MDHPRLIALDSMNFWITGKRESLTRALSRVDLVLLNETEVLMYSDKRICWTPRRRSSTSDPGRW